LRVTFERTTKTRPVIKVGAGEQANNFAKSRKRD